MNEAMLKVTKGPLQGQAFPIKYRELTIGRSKECKIRPSGYGYEELSREHARLKWDGAAFVVEDLGSRNGVIVDGQKVRSMRLHNGSRIELGDFAVELVLPPGGPQFADGAPASSVQAPPTPPLTGVSSAMGSADSAGTVVDRSRAPLGSGVGGGTVVGTGVAAGAAAPARPGRTTTFLVNQISSMKRTMLIGSGVGCMFLFIGLSVGLFALLRPHSDEEVLGDSTAQQIKDATVFIFSAKDMGDGKINMDMGSGFLVGPRMVVTNRHVTCDLQEDQQTGALTGFTPHPCEIIFFSGTGHEKKIMVTPDHIIAYGPKDNTDQDQVFHTDLSVLTLPEDAPTSPLPIGETAGLHETEVVYICGFPLGFGVDTSQPKVVKNGDLIELDHWPQVSLMKHNVDRVVRQGDSIDLLQLGGSAVSGNSGGPVVDKDGTVVGVHDAGAVNQEGGQAQSTIIKKEIPTEYLKQMLDTVNKGQNGNS